MARKTKKAAVPAKQEVERIELANGAVLVKYDDGSVSIIYPALELTAEEAQAIFGTDSDDEDEDDEDSDDEDEDDEEVTPEMLAEADFEELEDICDEKELDTDPDDYDEEDVEKLRAAIAKEMGIKLPKGKGKKGRK